MNSEFERYRLDSTVQRIKRIARVRCYELDGACLAGPQRTR